MTPDEKKALEEAVAILERDLPHGACLFVGSFMLSTALDKARQVLRAVPVD